MVLDAAVNKLRWRGRPLHPAARYPLARLLSQSSSISEAEIRLRAASAYLGEDRALARVLGRYKMFVDTRDIGHSSHLLLDGYWEMWTTRALIAAVRPGMTCVDIGANLGYFTLLMADLAGPAGRVHAFEPNPPIAARLRDTLPINGFGERVTVHELALGEVDGRRMRLVVPAHEPKNAHLAPVAEDGDRDGIVVETRRLDGFPEMMAADVIKIDVETAEEAVWEGMAALLASPRPLSVFLEFAAARYADPRAFLERIAARGFAIGLVDMERGASPATMEAILAAPAHVDQMLVLTR